MFFAKLRYWQWILISIVVGVMVVQIRQWANDDAGPMNIPADLTGQQRRFENALLGRIEGHRLLRNVEVYPRHLTTVNGRLVPIHVIKADYCTGEREDVNGKPGYRWRAAYFIAPVPYRPQIDVAEADGAVAAELARTLSHNKSGTVLDLLKAVKRVRAADYSYAWWDVHPWPILLGGSIAILGILLPLLIHVVAFGSVRRPCSARWSLVGLMARASVSRVRMKMPPEPTAELESSSTQQKAVSAAAPSAATPALVTLNAPTPQSGVARAADDKDFAMKPDDYYPTDRPHR